MCKLIRLSLYNERKKVRESEREKEKSKRQKQRRRKQFRFEKSCSPSCIQSKFTQRCSSHHRVSLHRMKDVPSVTFLAIMCPIENS